MNISQAIRERLTQLPAGQLFTPALLAGMGPRASIDQVLSRLTKAGVLERIGRGLYTVSQPSRFGLSRMPAPEAVAQAVAAAEGASIEVHGAEAARRFGLSTQVPVQPVFYTTGSSHNVRVGKLHVRLQNVAARKLVLAGPCLHCGIWVVGKSRQVLLPTWPASCPRRNSRHCVKRSRPCRAGWLMH
jgi:hypothetical protein